jgi:DNA-directed RNA polymerase subunit K/omega
MADNDALAIDPEAGAEPAEPINSRFLFVDVAAQRAKQLRRGALPRIERVQPVPRKLERIAMEEVRQRVIHYTLPTGYDGRGVGTSAGSSA